MHFPVFLDTCVLYPVVLTDTLLRVAEQSVFRPHWSGDVLDELRRNLARLPAVGDAGARRRTEAMERAFPDAKVVGYETLVDSMPCHEKDRHVMAAAIHSECQLVVTYNLKDFPESAMTPHQLDVVHPDTFLLDQLDLYPDAVVRAMRSQSRESARPHLSPRQLMTAFERLELSEFAAELTRRWPQLHDR